MSRAAQRATATSKAVSTKEMAPKAPKTDPKTQKAKKVAAKEPAKTATGKKSSTALSVRPAVTQEMSPSKTPEPATPTSKKRTRTVETAPAEKPTKRFKAGSAINTAPSQKLDVYVFGLGDCGELGLGPTTRDGKKPQKVRRPRLNDLLDAKTVGVVQVAVGGMHCVALTHDQKILTWGVNDNGALGRNTAWEAPTKDIDGDSEDSEDDDDDSGLNPLESTPTAIPAEDFGKENIVFVQVIATDSASFVLTADGSVYGWGTFRGNDGTVGFFTKEAIEAVKTKVEEKKYQRRPALIPQLKNIKVLAAGGNHVQALDHKGNVFAWGCGEQNQLGRRIVERTRAQALTPSIFGLPKNKITSISCGAFHNFAMDLNGQVYGWGLNNFGQTGINKGAGESDAIIEKPTIVKELAAHKIKEVKGGNHHSIACTEDGKLLVWGRCDDAQAGVDLDELPQRDLIFDARNKPRILMIPTTVPGIHAISVAAGIDNSFAITPEGEVYSWGFSANYRTGLGTEDSIEEATQIDNTALKGKRITFAGCGGQFSVLTGPAASGLPNGV